MSYIYKTANAKVRDGDIRDGYFCLDSVVTDLGFDGDENIDWVNVKKTFLASAFHLNTPLSLVSVDQGEGIVRLTWDDNNTEATGIEIYADIDSAGFVLVDTVLQGVETYDHTVGGLKNVIYKIRAYEIVTPSYSSYSDTSEITTTVATPACIADGHTLEQYDAYALSTITKDGSNLVSQWNDKLASGRNFVGVSTTKPVWNGAGNGILFSGKYMTVTVAHNQPLFYYMVVKMTAWTLSMVILDGVDGTHRQTIVAVGTTPQLSAFSGTASAANGNLAVGQWGIIRMLLNGASGKFIINNTTPVTGNFGSQTTTGLVLGARYNFASTSTIEVKEIICRNIDDGAGANEVTIYNYLANKYGLPTI